MFSSNYFKSAFSSFWFVRNYGSYEQVQISIDTYAQMAENI